MPAKSRPRAVVSVQDGKVALLPFLKTNKSNFFQYGEKPKDRKDTGVIVEEKTRQTRNDVGILVNNSQLPSIATPHTVKRDDSLVVICLS